MSERITITMPPLAEPDSEDLRRAIDKARRNANLTQYAQSDRDGRPSAEDSDDVWAAWLDRPLDPAAAAAEWEQRELGRTRITVRNDALGTIADITIQLSPRIVVLLAAVAAPERDPAPVASK